MNTLQSLCIAENSPIKTISLIELDKETNENIESLLEQNHNKQGITTGSSKKEDSKLIKNDSKLLRKKKTKSQVGRKNSKGTPRSKLAGFDFFQEKNPKRFSSAKQHKNKVESSAKPSKFLLKNGNSAKNHLKIEPNIEKVEPIELEKSYAKSFNSLTSKVCSFHISPKNQEKSPTCDIFLKLKGKTLNQYSAPSRIKRSNLNLKKKTKIKSDAFSYFTSSSDDSA